jgi:hypothetical protein
VAEAPAAAHGGTAAGSRHPAPLLLVAGFLLATLAWVFANPPGAAPDEPSHHAKAVAAGHLDLVGVRASIPPEAFAPEQLRQVQRSYRSFHVPRRLRFRSSLACTAFHPERTARCLGEDTPALAPDPQPSIVGAYQPFLYVPVGLVMRAGRDREGALLLGRVASAALSVGLLAKAVGLTWAGGVGGRPVRLLGLVVAVTPMVLFLSSEVGASGPEIAGAIALLAAVLRLSRPGPPAGPTAWWAAAGAGLLLGLSRPLAPLWVALAAALLVALAGPRRGWALVRAGGRPAAWAAGLTGAGVAANVAWSVSRGLRTPFRLGAVVHDAARLHGQLVRVGREAVGVFGWQDTAMPPFAYLAWAALLAGLVVAALVLADRRHRLVLLGLVVVVGLVTVLVGAQLDQNGFDLLGRYLLPVAGAVPLVAGEVLSRRAATAWAVRALVLAAAATAATIQLVGWVANARRYAVGGRGRVWFVPHAEWSPPGGWWPWLAVATVATAAQVAAALSVARLRD